MKYQRFRQRLVWLLIVVHLVTIYGCSVTNHVTLSNNEIPIGSNFKITTVTLKDGEVIEFDNNRGRYLEKKTDGKLYHVIVGTTHGKDVEIDPEKVREVKFEQQESDGSGSFLVGFLLGLPVGAGILFLIAVLSIAGD